MKTLNYLSLEEICNNVIAGIADEEEFIKKLDWFADLIEQSEASMEDIDFSYYNDDDDISSSHSLYIEGIKHYKEALSVIRKYLETYDIKDIKNGLDMALGANETLVRIQMISGNKNKKIEEMQSFYNKARLSKGFISKDLSKDILFTLNYTGVRTSIPQDLENARRKSEIIKFIPLFSVLSSEKIEKISHRVKYKKYEKEFLLFNYGDTANEVYIVKSGEVGLYSRQGGDREYTVMIKGDMFGEMGVISDAPRSLTAKVLTPIAELYMISRQDFLYILNNYPEVNLNLSKSLCQRIDKITKRLLEI